MDEPSIFIDFVFFKLQLSVRVKGRNAHVASVLATGWPHTHIGLHVGLGVVWVLYVWCQDYLGQHIARKSLRSIIAADHVGRMAGIQLQVPVRMELIPPSLPLSHEESTPMVGQLTWQLNADLWHSVAATSVLRASWPLLSSSSSSSSA